MKDHRPLFALILVYVLVIGVTSAAVQAPILILVLNGLLLSVSGGVMVAYAPVASAAVLARAPKRGDYLGLGIFLGFSAVFSMRCLSICVRELGASWLVNSHWASSNIAIFLLAGALHLAAPNAVEGRVPRERWVMTGILVSLGILVAFALWTLRGQAVIAHPPVEML